MEQLAWGQSGLNAEWGDLMLVLKVEVAKIGTEDYREAGHWPLATATRAERTWSQSLSESWRWPLQTPR